MEYVLVNRTDEIVHTTNSVNGVDEAVDYFMKIKLIESKESFNNLWKVMTRVEYLESLNTNLRKPSSSTYQWWVEDKKDTDDALSGKDGL